MGRKYFNQILLYKRPVYTVTCMIVNIDAVWNGNWIYCTLIHTARNYSAVANSHSLQFTAARKKSSQSVVSSSVVAW
jgi:hypothetical protein